MSACPSIPAHRAASAVSSSGKSHRARALTAPATTAAAEEPSPRPIGMSELASSTTPRGTSRPAARQARSKPRYRRSSSGGPVRAASAPRRSIWMRVAPPEGWRRVITATQRSTAIPTQSNPDPRLALDPGTRTVTVALMRGLRCPGKRDLEWRRKLPGPRIERQARRDEPDHPFGGATEPPWVDTRRPGA